MLYIRAMNAQPMIRYAAASVGGVAKLAEKIGVTRAAVYNWRRVPAERVLEIERITGVSRHVLRPDLYPRDETRSERVAA